MIKDVRLATPVEWINWDSVPTFPVVLYAMNSGTYNLGREQTYNIQFWFLDKSGAEGEFETDVTSDMHSVAFDIINKLRLGSNPYLINDTIQWNAVTEKFEDYLSGVNLSIDLSIKSEYNACDIPTA